MKFTDMSILFDLFKKMKGDSTQKVDFPIRNQRLDTCRACVIDGEWGMNASGRCIKCGCFLVEKTKYADEECPIGNWKQDFKNTI